MTDRLANYEPVQARLTKFWADHPDGRIVCELLEHDEQHVLALARVWRHEDDTFPATNGWAQEFHDGSPVNKQGWMIENAETSAIGRALANLGYATDRARPSSEDMERATARRRREIADSNLAQVTFDRLKTIKNRSEIVQSLRDLSNEHGRKLTLAELAGFPDWRALVDTQLDQFDTDSDSPDQVELT